MWTGSSHWGGVGGGRKPETGIIYVHSVNSYVWSLIMRHLRHPPKSFRFLFCQLMRLTLSCLLLSTSTHNASKKSRPMTPTTLWKVWVSSGVTLFLSSNCSRQTSRTSHIYIYMIYGHYMDLYQVIQFFASFFGWLEDQKVTLNHLGYVYIYMVDWLLKGKSY